MIVRLRSGGGMRFAAVLVRLEAGDELGPGQRQQIAQLRRVEEVRAGQDHRPIRVQTMNRDGLDAIALDGSGGGLVVEQDFDPAGADERGQHFVEDGEGDTRFVTQTRDESVAGVEMGARRASAVSG